MSNRLNLTDVDSRALAMIDADDPGVKLACEEQKAAAIRAWVEWGISQAR